jgi:pimeloyl-ACP methyl ester carboxylesterase
MRYLRAGFGPPLVLLHGLLGYSFSWRHNLLALAAQRTVYAPDQLGAGFSDRVPGLDCTLRAVASRTLEFLDAVGITNFDLLGTSHGGGVAIMLAGLLRERGNHRLRRLILVAPINPWSPHGRRLGPFLARPGISQAFAWTMPRARFSHPYILRRLYGDPRRISPGTLEGYVAPNRIPGTFPYALSVLRTWLEDLEELKRHLPALADVPTLLLWGDEDAAVYASSAESLRQHLPNAKLVRYPGVGHLPYEEVPTEFNRTVLEFLKDSSPAA